MTLRCCEISEYLLHWVKIKSSCILLIRMGLFHIKIQEIELAVVEEMNVSSRDLSALKTFAKTSLCSEVFRKAGVIKSQSGPCRRRFLGFISLFIFGQRFAVFPIASSS